MQASANAFRFPTTGITVRDRAILLAIDDASLPLRKNLCHYLTKPTVRIAPVLAPTRHPDAPDNAAAHFYGGVVREADGRYRMWYYACHWDRSVTPNDPLTGNLIEGPVCYAESDDGLTWTKPELNQVEWHGSRRNNIIKLATLHNPGVHVIKDDADPDPARRYKMVYNYRPKNRDFWTVRTAASPDGLAWTDGAELPFDGFLEQTGLYEHNGWYYISGHMLLRSEGGHRSGRQGYAIVSPDFTRWLPEYGESFLLPEPADPEARGMDKDYQQVHIGVAPADFGNVLVGLYCLWYNSAYPSKRDWFGLGTTAGDFGLVVSNDGLHFREPVKGHVWLHRDDSPPALPPGIRHTRILCQGNGILNVGDETRIYHGRWANTADINDYYAEVGLATLPRDRWGALGLFPEAQAGSVWSAPVTFPAAGCAVTLNADGVRGLRVEIADDRCRLLPEYAGANSGSVKGEDGLDGPLTWRAPLAKLAGQTVRLRIHFTQTGPTAPRLYAVNLRAGE